MPKGDQGAFLNAVACAVSTYCTAVGQQTTGSGGHFALAEQWVLHIGTATSLTSSSTPAVTGQPIVLTARVAALQGGFGTPTGSVTFTVSNAAGASLRCASGNTVSLSNGAATCTIGAGTLFPTQGPYDVKASYSGGANFLPSAGSLNPPQVVDKDATTVVIRSNVNPSVYGQRISFVATVAARPPGTGTPTGTVTFTLNGQQQCDDGTSTFTLKGGMATCPIQFDLSPGTYSVVATYSGDSNFLSSSNSSSPFRQAVDKDRSSTAVTSDVNPSAGGAVNYTAVVTANPPGSGSPQGTVTFTATNQLTSVVTDLNCVPNSPAPTDVVTITFDPNKGVDDAICHDPGGSLVSGNYTITATYSGSADFDASFGTMTETVSIPT